MRIVKQASEIDEDGYAEQTAADQRHLKLHGSTNKRGMARAAGTLQRMKEKPKGSRRA